jgi:hypothetical protein
VIPCMAPRVLNSCSQGQITAFNASLQSCADSSSTAAEAIVCAWGPIANTNCGSCLAYGAAEGEDPPETLANCTSTGPAPTAPTAPSPTAPSPTPSSSSVKPIVAVSVGIMSIAAAAIVVV